MEPETPDKATGAAFPATRTSIVVGVRSNDPQARRRAYETLIGSYWRPVYTYLRLRWRRNAEDAQDLTQDFLARAFETQFLGTYDPSRSRLRTFLRVCLDRFVLNAERDSTRVKRGGHATILSLDFASAEGDLVRLDPPDPSQGEEFFEREWVRSFFSTVVEAVRLECKERGKELHFRLFERYDLDDDKVSYEDLAHEFDIRVTDVTNHLASVRRAFRRIALDRLRELTASDEEFRAEARSLLGGEFR